MAISRGIMLIGQIVEIVFKCCPVLKPRSELINSCASCSLARVTYTFARRRSLSCFCFEIVALSIVFMLYCAYLYLLSIVQVLY